MTGPSTRIELIEDDRLLAQQFIHQLSNEGGWTIHHSSDVVEAIHSIDTHLPQVIVLDVLLPAATAFTLLHELQSYDDTRVIPVIVCSSIAEDLAREDLSPYGVVAVLDKATVTPDQLRRAVRAAL
jgi:CheY-like chemotaxis protein